MLSAEDKILIKILRQEKRYGAKRLLAEFPKKCWPLTTVKSLLWKIDDSRTVNRQLGSGRKRNANDTRTRNRYRKPVGLPENLYRFSASVLCKSVSIFSGTEI